MKTFLKVATAVVAIMAAAPSIAATASFSGTGFAIPDGAGTTIGTPVSSSLSIGALGTINSITVTLGNLTHSWAGDLAATLSNGSTTITLFDRLGVSGSGVGNSMNFSGSYSFSDSATLTLPEFNNGTDITPGAYLPAQALSAFNGLNTAGTWTLSIGDYAQADTGRLGSWRLDVDYATAGAVPEPATWAMMIGGFAFAGAAMRRRRTAVSFA